FGMHVGYTQRRREPEAIERALGATWVPSLDELCASSDAITIHTPLTDETRHLFSAERLAKLRPGSVLVNAARGPIVDDAALARPNAVLAPHIGSADRATREAMASTAAANVIRVLRGEPPLTPVAPSSS